MNEAALIQQLQFLLYDARKLLPTLHERVALAALQGDIANPDSEGDITKFAKRAWDYADAFMAEMAKRLKDAEEKKP